MSKFDLEKALAGEPVVLRDGQKAYVRHRETELDTGHPLMGYGMKEGRADVLTWTECGHFYEDKEETELDIVGMWIEPLMFEHWSLLHEDIAFLAKDENGCWYGHHEKPSLYRNPWRGGGWRTGGEWQSAKVLKPTLFPECDWENSLIVRPEQ